MCQAYNIEVPQTLIAPQHLEAHIRPGRNNVKVEPNLVASCRHVAPMGCNVYAGYFVQRVVVCEIQVRSERVVQRGRRSRRMRNKGGAKSKERGVGKVWITSRFTPHTWAREQGRYAKEKKRTGNRAPSLGRKRRAARFSFFVGKPVRARIHFAPHGCAQHYSSTGLPSLHSTRCIHAVAP